MCFSTYYPNMCWTPCATYPQVVVSYQPPPPLVHTTIVSLPMMSTHHHPHNFPNSMHCPQRGNPPTPPQSCQCRTPDRATRHEESSISRVFPEAPATPDPYRLRPLPNRAPPVADQGAHNTVIDPILALPKLPFGRLRFKWDLADNPMQVILNCCPEDWRAHGIHRCDLMRAAVCDGTRALERLVLVFAGLPRGRETQIEVTHVYPTMIVGGIEDVLWVTVYDVLLAIFQRVMSPIEGHDMERLYGRRLDTVIHAAEARWARRGKDSDGRAVAGAQSPAQYLKIDYLGQQRRFKGIRLARGDEVPDGERLGEVFVVELGASE